MKTKKSCIFSGIFIFIFLNVISLNVKADSKLRTGFIKLQDKKFIVIGISSHTSNPISNLDFRSLGFEGKEIDSIDPKFLVEVPDIVSKGIKVYSFELTEQGSHSLRIPLLISTSDAKTQEYLHFSGNILSGLGKTIGLGIGAATSAGRFPAKEYEDRLRTQAAYLMELIIQHREFPELSLALKPEAPAQSLQMLFDLGGALLTRYNPKSNWAGTQVPGEGRADFFERWMGQIQEDRTRNKSNLNNLSNQYGLKLFSIGNVLSLVYIDPKLHDRENPAGEFLDRAKTRTSLESRSIDVTPIDESQYQPGCLVAFTQKLGSVNLLNFNFPGSVSKEVRELRSHRLGREIAGGFIPLSYWVIKGIHKLIEDKTLEANNSKYLSRKEAYGSTLALAETQIFEPASAAQLSLEPFMPALRSVNPLGDVENILDLLAYLVREEDRLGYITHQPTREELAKLKSDYHFLLKQELKRLTPAPQQKMSLSSSRASRGPASLFSWLKPEPPQPVRNPMIIFMIDGLRPDRFKIAAEEGLIPNLRSLFYERGTEVESFTPRSLTLPSWSTILTGYESDTHGIRSNSPTSRTEVGITDNYLNPVKDLLEAKNWKKNRAFQRVEEDQTGEPGKVWFPAYFGSKQTLYNYLPVVNGASTPSSALIDQFFSNLASYYNDSWFPPTALDIASAKNTAGIIEADRKKGNLRLIMNWYSGVDEAQHYNNHLLPVVLRDIDQAVGLVLQAAQNHPVLKNATVLLISDHGHTGGFDAFCEHSPLFKRVADQKTTLSGPLVANTSFNLTHFLGGHFRGFEHLQFNVATPSPVETRPDLSWMGEFFMPALHINYKRFTHTQEPTALIDYSGSSLAQIYLKGQAHWKRRLSYYELTNFFIPESGMRTHLFNDLFKARMGNLMITDDDLLSRLTDLTKRHPVHFIAMPLEQNENITSLDKWGASDETGSSTRDPVLVLSKDHTQAGIKAGIIFTKSDYEGRDWFRYVVVKNFNQEASGRYAGVPSVDPNDDPLQYIGQVPTAELSSQWKTDHEWLRLARDHQYPTAIFSLARTLTLAPKFTNLSVTRGLSESVKTARKAEIPDFILIANPGFGFHDGAPMQSDHGGLSYEEVRNSFFISSMNKALFQKHEEIREPVLTRDYAATLLEYAGLDNGVSINSIPQTQGDSFKAMIDAINPVEPMK